MKYIQLTDYTKLCHIYVLVLLLLKLRVLRSPGRDTELFSLHFFISLPQDSKSFPQDRKSFPQVSKSLPQDTKLFPQVSKSLPQDKKSFPQVSKSFPQVRKLLPQVSKVVLTRY